MKRTTPIYNPIPMRSMIERSSLLLQVIIIMLMSLTLTAADFIGPYAPDYGKADLLLGGYVTEGKSGDQLCIDGEVYLVRYTAFMAATPEMDVLGNGISIPDGDITPIPDDNTDFGAVLTTGTKTLTFTIENTGVGDLILDGAPLVAISGTHSADYTVTAAPTTPVTGGGSTTFDIEFSPGATGLRTATVTIENNDPDEDPYTFDIEGTGATTNSMSVNFDGTDDYFDMGNSNFTAAFSQITMEAWIRTTTDAAVFVRGPNAGLAELSTHFFQAKNGTGGWLFTVQTNTTAIKDGNWHHLAVTFDKDAGAATTDQVKVYFDGISQSYSVIRPTTSEPIGASTDFTRVGAVPWGGSHFNGDIDEIRIWNYARTQEQIAAHRFSEMEGTETGLLHYYKMEVDACGLADCTGNGLLGTPNGTGGTNNLPQYVAATPTIADYACAGGGESVPEMDVKGGSPLTSIMDGATSPGFADSTDFGIVATTGATNVNTFTIENTGVTDLTLDGAPLVAISGTHASDFTVTAQPTSPVTSGGGTTTFKIEFDPSADGLRTASVSIDNDDCNEDPYNFNIQGTGAPQGAAIDFDGSNDFVTCPPAVNPAGPFTVEFWFNANSTGGNPCPLGTRLGGVNGLLFYTYATGVQYFIGGTGWHNLVSTVPISAGTWYHVAGTYDGVNKMQIFINGTLDNTLTTNGTYNYFPANNFFIGKNGDGFNFNGKVDEVRVWNRVLCEAEISAQMNCELSGSETGLVAYYDFNDGLADGNNTGVTTLTDRTSNGYNGTLSNLSLSGSSSNWTTPGGVTTGSSCPAFNAPEMDVQGNGMSIADGDNTPSTSDHTDFGDITSGGALSRTFTIENTGAANLILDGAPLVAVSGTHASDFTVSALPTSPVTSGGGTTTFVVDFSPSGTGTRTATLTIENDDCDEDPYVFDIQGTGVAATALDFDGVDDRVTSANTVTLFGTEPATIELWVKRDGATSYASPIGIGTQKLYFNLTFSGNTWFWIEGVTSYNFGTLVPDNTWTHVAITYDGVNTWRGYINGMPAPNPTHTLTYGPLTGSVFLGSRGAAPFWDGGVDEVRIWKQLRSDAEILANYNTEITSMPPCMELYWKMDHGVVQGGNTGVTMCDDESTNTDNDGTLTNMALTGAASNWIEGSGITAVATTYGSVPEMDVQGGNPLTSIASGDNSPSTSDGTDFGAAVEPGQTVSQTFTIENTGTGNLTLNGAPLVDISGTHAADFTVTAQPTSPVTSGGGTTTFTIEFDPSATGVRSATVSIANDDCDENPYTFDIQGEGVADINTNSIEVDGTNDFGLIPDGIPALSGAAQATVEFWVKADATGGFAHMFNFTGNVFRVQFTGGNQVNFYSSGVGQYNITTGLTIGQWQHVAVVFDGSQPNADKLKIYVDGVRGTLSGTPTATTLTTGTGNAWLGSANAGTGLYFDGKLDEVRVWSRALTEA